MVVISCPLVCVKYDEVSVGLVIASQIALQEDGRCEDRLPHRTAYSFESRSAATSGGVGGAGQPQIVVLLSFSY